MLKKVVKSSVLLALAVGSLNAAAFNEQAEKDRKALIQYFETKFEDAEKNKDKFFPYSTDAELAGFEKGVKHKDFALGSYAYNKSAKEQYLALEFQGGFVQEELVAQGEKLYNKKFANGKSVASCFPDSTIGNEYPKFDETKKEVVSLTKAINDCYRANGEKELNTKAGDMPKIQAYIAFKTGEAGKVVDIKIPTKEAAEAYERGKKDYYAQRGYINVSCASCHVQGTGQRVRNEYMSPLLGATTHFPVFRLKYENDKAGDGLGTLERRMSGCVVDQGQKPAKDESKWMQELLYFMAYMSNGMKIDGPDLRK
jgi:sulfur-oxidizing protein SoxA